MFMETFLLCNLTLFLLLLMYNKIGDIMKSKAIQIALLCFIVFMLGGILASVKDEPSNEITEITSDFVENEEYDESGYYSDNPFDESNVNGFGRLNGQIGNIVSKGVNKGIDLFFDLMKKLVS